MYHEHCVGLRFLFRPAFSIDLSARGRYTCPGFRRTYTSESDSVTGWGKLRVKDASGNPSPYLNVLQVQSMTITTDSFFLKGAPFTNTMLTFFNVTQGQKDTIYEQNYYRLGEVTPLAEVRFRDAAFTLPIFARTHVQRLQNVSVPGVAKIEGMHIFPNPVTGRQFCLELTEPVGTYTDFRIYNTVGTAICSGKMPGAARQVTINIPQDAPAGVYYLWIQGAGGKYNCISFDCQ